MKSLLTFMLALALSVGAFAQSSNASDQVAVAKARVEVQADCLAGSGDISSSVWQAEDGTYYVYFFNTFNCPPNQICPLYLRIAPLARVTLDAEFNVIGYRCGFSIFELQ